MYIFHDNFECGDWANVIFVNFSEKDYDPFLNKQNCNNVTAAINGTYLKMFLLQGM
jgi:hypothetical protein